MSYSRVLVTGGAGFVGSHVCKALSKQGIIPIAYDNLSNGFLHNVKYGPFVFGDILDDEKLAEAIKQHRPEACIHFAALAYVGASVVDPHSYYKVNVQGTLNVLDQLRLSGINHFVFSSSCATYGVPEQVPISETTPQAPISPYGSSKLMGEKIISDYSKAYGFKAVCLRYFNACGADPNGELYEEHDPETHIIPRCLMAASNLIPFVEIFGSDYPTRDGTCVRDYIHVNDLAAGHLLALDYIKNNNSINCNLGSGSGLTVLEIILGIERILGRPVPHRLRSRRAGDPPILTADIQIAQRILGFQPTHSDLETILKSASLKYASRETIREVQ